MITTQDCMLAMDMVQAKTTLVWGVVALAGACLAFVVGYVASERRTLTQERSDG